MLQTAYRSIAKTPTPLAGLALAIASLGWCWENAIAMQGNMQYLSACIAGVLLSMLALKFTLYPNTLIEDLKHPVVGSVAPTFAMAAMVVSNSIAVSNPHLGDFIWLVAILIHVVFLVCFLVHRFKSFALHHMVPSWFIPPIGLIVADVSFAGNPDLLFIAQGVFNFGLMVYAIMLPVMIYRLIFCDEIIDAAKPTIAVLAAPASLSLAGYLSITSQPSPVIVAVLMGIAVLMTFVIYVSLQRLMRLPFSPAFAAFTFPLVISATALFKVATWFTHKGIEQQYVSQLETLATMELIIATLVVGYVCLRYFHSYCHFFMTVNKGYSARQEA